MLGNEVEQIDLKYLGERSRLHSIRWAQCEQNGHKIDDSCSLRAINYRQSIKCTCINNKFDIDACARKDLSQSNILNVDYIYFRHRNFCWLQRILCNRRCNDEIWDFACVWRKVSANKRRRVCGTTKVLTANGKNKFICCTVSYQNFFGMAEDRLDAHRVHISHRPIWSGCSFVANNRPGCFCIVSDRMHSNQRNMGVSWGEGSYYSPSKP